MGGREGFMIIQRGSGWSKLTVTFEPPPADPSKILARMERSRRNSQWLQAHWADLLPKAEGKHLVVAGEEAFIADSPEEAWAMAKRAHPEDDSATIQYVSPDRGAKIYANRG
jgi:hypothetical protein